MTEARSNSGVRNLRAMFENNNAAASPETRGRSPSRRINTDVNRPTSKVKASFISVEPSGLISPLSPTGPFSPTLGSSKGTEHGANSIDPHRRESFSFDAGADAVVQLKKVVSEEKEARKNSVFVEETIPEQAVESREPSATRALKAPDAVRKMPSLGVIMKGSEFPESQAQAQAQTQAQEQPAELPEQQAPAQPAQTQAPPAGTAKIEAKLAALSLAETEADNPDKIVTGAQEEASLKPGDPKDEALISSSEASQPATETQTPSESSSAAPAAAQEAPAANERPHTPVNKAASPTKTNGKLSTKKPVPISVAKASPVKPSSARSPPSKTATRQPKTPTTPRAAHAPAASKHVAAGKDKAKPIAHKEVPKASIRETSRSSVRSATASMSAAAAAKAKAPAAETKKPAAKPATAKPASTTATSPVGLKKPKPKSPTRPVRLPSHLTAPTAASAAKHGEEGAHKAPAARKPATTTTTTTTTTRPTTTRPAASTASKPTTTARKPASHSAAAAAAHHEKRPASRASTAGGASEGFLARMMRPTAASASKAHDKPASPPRRSNSTRVGAKPKTGTAHESTATKAKKKVEEVAAKAKEVVTGHHNDEHEEKHGEQGAEHVSEAPVETTQPTSEEVAEKEHPAEAQVPESVPEEQPQADVPEKQDQAPAPEAQAQEAH